jgi:mRNA interferase MazF
MINQGDIYWVDLGEPPASEPGYRHPHVVVQNNIFTRSQLKTVVVCALISNLRRAQAPGDVVLESGEGNLPKQSAVNVSQIYTVDKSQLDEYIGTLSSARVHEIINGIKLVIEPREPE